MESVDSQYRGFPIGIPLNTVEFAWDRGKPHTEKTQAFVSFMRHFGFKEVAQILLFRITTCL